MLTKKWRSVKAQSVYREMKQSGDARFEVTGRAKEGEIVESEQRKMAALRRGAS